MEVNMTEWPNENDWHEAKRRALATMGKRLKTEPDESWEKKILKARHSPIRRLRFSFDLIGIPSFVATHLARHIHAQPYIQSQRNDRQDNYDRNAARQDIPVNMIWDLNGEELLVIANKRLCKKADKTTRLIVQKMMDEVLKKCPEFSEELVPMCKYAGCCKEMEPCNYIEVVKT